MIPHIPETPLVNETVVFDASASYDPDGTIVSYSWDFGEGTSTVTTPEPIIDHTYRAEGNYTVTLNATDNDGLSDTESKSLTVINHLVARFSYSPPHPTVSETITFNATESTP